MASDRVLVTERPRDAEIRRERGPGAIRRLAYALLVLECVVILVPSIYGRLAPKLFGVPFFYWFQLLWILAAMVITGIVYLLTTLRSTSAPPPPAPRENAGGVR
ncbi:MAG: DUF3311 domain-containing protein [Solirubrobacterales bacterium]|nr:DUF3311 domain-containing protein [Solirubrobacterales bacterium]MBV9715507.1 DUF3311 domain-containing protein [Solirubrobacterales bacterium]